MKNQDKFADYYNTEERIQELSQYVHENMKVISTKMISEMRRKLDITPEMQNTDGYVSLLVSLQGRMFNELVYGLSAICQNLNMKVHEIVPIQTLNILLKLLKDENPLNGLPRNDVKSDPEWVKKYYEPVIEELRSIVEALPK